MHKVDHYEYDITPTDNDEIILVFKVSGEDCEMKIPKGDLERMLWFINNA